MSGGNGYTGPEATWGIRYMFSMLVSWVCTDAITLNDTLQTWAVYYMSVIPRQC